MGQVEGLKRTLAKHPFFKDMSKRARKLIAGCSAHAVFHDGDQIYREGEPADTFYLIRRGTVALEVQVPGREPLVIQTLGDGEVLGWSWLVPPYRTRFDSRAIGLVRVLSIDGKCLRGKCDEDHEMGYEFYKHLFPLVVGLLAGVRLQMIDIYGHPMVYSGQESEASDQTVAPAKPAPSD